MTELSNERSDVLSVAQEITSRLFDRYPPMGPLERPSGYARGIDYYSRPDFTRVVGNIYSACKRKGGRYPDLIKPVLTQRN
jgi:hypothetical protein